MSEFILPRKSLRELRLTRTDALDRTTLSQAREIVEAVERDGETALLALAEKFGDWQANRPWWFGRPALEAALETVDAQLRRDLEAMRDQIALFASAQRNAIHDIDVAVPGGRAGHQLIPVERAGCYAPAGRFPLPSSLLMGVVTARMAGVRTVWAASPNPTAIMLASAAIAGADGLLAIGGAQAIAALAFGAGPVPACDMIVGPGNRWVTAAKHVVSSRVGIDFLAGPSELVVLADESASPEQIAADLIAQAEHDPDALPVLVTTEEGFVARVNEALAFQLGGLATASIARVSLGRGGIVVCSSLKECVDTINDLAPEHLQLVVTEPTALVTDIQHAGALFLGGESAEVFGDYGIGPNHVLPTGRGARSTGGLSVFTFLRPRSWLRMDTPSLAVPATARMARLEGLEGHARAAEMRG